MAQENIEQLKATLKVKEKLPGSLYPLLDRRDGAAEFACELPKNFEPTSIMDGLPDQDAWTSVAAFYRAQGRIHEALLSTMRFTTICLSRRNKPARDFTKVLRLYI